MNDVSIFGRLQTADRFRGQNLSVSGAAIAGSTTLTVAGNDCYIEQLFVNHSVLMSGTNCTVRTVSVTTATSTLVGPIFQLGGTNNRVSGVRYTINANIAANTALFLVTGTSNVAESVRVSTGTLTATRMGLQIAACVACTIRDFSMTLGAGIPLAFVDDVDITGERCRFVSSAGSEAVIDASAIVGVQSWHFTDCLFDQGENTSSTVGTLALDGLGSNPAVFTKCTFNCAQLSAFTLLTTNVKFDSCTFAILNPIVAGTRRLGGTFDGQTDPLLRFSAQTLLIDCVIDASDAEVNNDAGEPTFTDALFARLTGAEAQRLSLINVNQQMQSNTNLAGLIELSSSAKINGLVVEFTATAAVQPGTQALAAVLNLRNNNLEVTDFELDTTSYPGGSGGAYFAAPLSAIINLKLDSINITGGFFGFLYTTTLTSVAGLRASRCSLGTTGSGCVSAGGLELPHGDDHRWEACDFYTNNTATEDVMRLFDGYRDITFDRCTFGSVASKDPAAGALFRGAGGAITVYTFRFTGCKFYVVATGVGTMPFDTDVTWSSCVGAGNTWLFNGGTPGAPNFSASINTW